MVSKTETQMINILASTKPYTADPIDIKAQAYNLLFERLIPSVFTDSPLLPRINKLFEDESFSSFSKEKIEEITAIKADVDQVFIEELSKYQKALKNWAEGNNRLDAMRKSDKTSAKQFEQQVEIVAGLEADKGIAYQNFLKAKRAEVYFRALPSTYEEWSTSAIISTIGAILRKSLAYSHDSHLRLIVQNFYARIYGSI